MAALPTVVLVGRPNVGKSTLFNRLTQSRDALVADVPGLTRDRRYGQGRLGPRPYLVVNTAGFDPTSKEGITREMARQAEQAIREADVVLFLVDGRAGLTAHDRDIADYLRRLGRPVRLVVNKTEGMRQVMATAEFHALGLGEPMAISAAHGEGVRQMIAEVLADFPEDEEVAPPQDEDVPRVAVVGRPNVGKSTLINALLGEERLIAYDQPGTTRDAIEVPFVQGTRRYVLVNTAGVRRKGRVTEAVEKFSVIKTMQAVERANVAVLVLDATQEIADQDAHLGGFILEAGRALVVAVNKWDAVNDYRRSLVKTQLASKLGFLSFARTVFLSAAKGQGLAPLLKAVTKPMRLPLPSCPRRSSPACCRNWSNARRRRVTGCFAPSRAMRTRGGATRQ